jgi:glycosyltransferase involved in cell wall biosynthesis
MTAPPRVSVVTVVYNDEANIAATLDSVLAQDYEAMELVVIDGGSKDRTRDIVSSYAPRLAHVVSEPDRGIYDAMNKGVRAARGQFVLFMNSGDVFASTHAISSAMAAARPDTEQALFGGWLRRSGTRPDVRCRPDLARGLFNHQAVLYSRSIHAWHGEYVTVRGLTTADYLFFATLHADGRVDCREIDADIAAIDIRGVSGGLQTFSQKHAVDYLCGRASRMRLLAVLGLHPLYFRLKSLLRR